VNAQANLEAIRDRLAGEPATRFRAAAMAGVAGVSVAVAVYRAMRGPDEDDSGDSD
jgi:uncharacterized protein (DUF2267 family)